MFEKLFRLLFSLTSTGMAVSIRFGVGKGMLCCTGEHVNRCFANFSPAGGALKYLHGQYINSKNFIANKFFTPAK